MFGVLLWFPGVFIQLCVLWLFFFLTSKCCCVSLGVCSRTVVWKGPLTLWQGELGHGLTLPADILSYVRSGHPYCRAETRKRVELGFVITEKAFRKVSQNCVSIWGQGNAQLRSFILWVPGLQFEEMQVAEITSYTSWLLLLIYAGSVDTGALLWVICNVFASAALLIQLGREEPGQWRREISCAEAKLHS